MKLLKTMLFLLVSLTMFGCSGILDNNDKPLSTVPYVDLNRYLGVWYEVASYPNKFQEGCVGTRATYSLRDDGKISVLNDCFYKSFDGKFKRAKGVATVVDTTTNAKLKVSFRYPFYGDYWIIDLGENYEYAVVGHPKRKYLWILSRTKDMSSEIYESIISRIIQKGYDPSKLVKTLQK